jgi:two-component system, OmpR family, sensor histidine kinase RstB
MTRLFVRIYLSVLVVLVVAWYIHGTVLQARNEAELARIVEKSHGGGARLVAHELDVTPLHLRDQLLAHIRKRFNHPLEVLPVAELPISIQRRLSGGEDVCSYQLEEGRTGIAAVLSGGSEVVVFGPFPDYSRKAIEDALAGWMRLTADKVAFDANHEATVAQLQKQFDYPVQLITRADLPEEQRTRIEKGEDIVFYTLGNDQWFAATPLTPGADMLRFGPFFSIDRSEHKAAATTLALVLLPAALAIALLLRPVARQLRQVENAAKAITAGDLSARVDERRIGSARPLAQAFNSMAGRTETLLRTQRELLQAVSHELRTPLSRMRFAIDLIETAKDDAERKRRLDGLTAAAEDLDELVDELLRYVRMETAEPLLHKEPVGVQDVLDVLLPKYAVLHPSIDFRVTIQIEQDEKTAFVDRLGFHRVLGNLLSNAGRYAKSKVTIRAESIDGAIIIDVDDDGCGIPESERERVFEPFVRLDDCTSENNRGVGLGLALVKRIVTRHGGSVELLASPLGGCRARTVWPDDRRVAASSCRHA